MRFHYREVAECKKTQGLYYARKGRITFKEAYELTGLRGGSLQVYARRAGTSALQPELCNYTSGR
ncbi:MAG: hypothetical protein AB1477_06240 [Acidobacteriota bacterium]